MAKYLFKLADAEPSAWQLKGVAAASYTVAVLGQYLMGLSLLKDIVADRMWMFDTVLVFNTRWSLRITNAIGLVKLITLLLYEAVNCRI